MNDQLNIDRPSGFRNAIYGMIGSMFIFVVTIIWYGGQLKESLESRLTSIERQQSISQTVIDKLNDAREESRVHGAQIDGKLTEMTGQLSAILELVKDAPSPPPDVGGIPNAGPENFRHTPSRARGQ